MRINVQLLISVYVYPSIFTRINVCVTNDIRINVFEYLYEYYFVNFSKMVKDAMLKFSE